MYVDGYDDVTKTEEWKRSEAKIIQKQQKEKRRKGYREDTTIISDEK